MPRETPITISEAALSILPVTSGAVPPSSQAQPGRRSEVTDPTAFVPRMTGGRGGRGGRGGGRGRGKTGIGFSTRVGSGAGGVGAGAASGSGGGEGGGGGGGTGESKGNDAFRAMLGSK